MFSLSFGFICLVAGGGGGGGKLSRENYFGPKLSMAVYLAPSNCNNHYHYSSQTELFSLTFGFICLVAGWGASCQGRIILAPNCVLKVIFLC